MAKPWLTGGLPLLNVAEVCPATRALGPGLRAVVWVQGCPFHCPGCIAEGWTKFTLNQLASPEEIAAGVLANPDVTGLTFSGGEPMLQAAGLAEVYRQARKQRDLTLIVYSGYTLEKLKNAPPGSGIERLLSLTDVLIDGLYINALNDNRGLRGSQNQHIHHLTNRLDGFDFETGTRRLEVQVKDGSALIVGVPPRQVPAHLDLAFRRVQSEVLPGDLR